MVLADICQAEYSADEQKHPQCLMRKSFWEVNAMYSLGSL